ncbi:MAG: 3-hydroxyacyl-CoA dehydrogenase family protein [Chitinophagaceae bacterium]
MEIKTVGVCGAGTMGSGIAQVAAAAGFATILYELNEAQLQAAQQKLQKDLATLVEKGKITSEKKDSILQNITFTSDISRCRADLIIEAIVEKPEIKTTLFSQLAAINGSHTIFASNTSSLSISELGKTLPQPQNFAGLHFFNPAPLMKLVEVVKGAETSEEVVQALLAFTKAVGKTGVLCKDAPGFIVNRVARPYYIESLRLAEEGLADYATIDALLQSRGFKMGPFKLMDLIGNDVNYAVSCSVHEQLGRPERLKPSYLQKEKVDNKQFGKKTGSGYYEY